MVGQEGRHVVHFPVQNDPARVLGLVPLYFVVRYAFGRVLGRVKLQSGGHDVCAKRLGLVKKEKGELTMPPALRARPAQGTVLAERGAVEAARRSDGRKERSEARIDRLNMGSCEL